MPPPEFIAVLFSILTLEERFKVPLVESKYIPLPLKLSFLETVTMEESGISMLIFEKMPPPCPLEA